VAFFLNVDGVGRHVLAREDEVAFVGDGPLDGLAHGKLHGLCVELLSDEALLTSRIEGGILDRDSLQSSIRKHFGLATDRRKTTPAEAGISELMFDAYHHHAEPLDDARLFAWHRMFREGMEGFNI